MPSSLENLPQNMEHSDSSTVAEAVRRELQQRGEQVSEAANIAEMLDSNAVEAYAQEKSDEKRKAMLKELVESILEKESHY